VDTISRALNTLYEEKEWPKNPKEFISKYFTTILYNGLDAEQLQIENEKIKQENAEMEELINGFTNAVPPVGFGDIMDDEPPEMEPPKPTPQKRASIVDTQKSTTPKAAASPTQASAPVSVPASTAASAPDPTPVPAPTPAPVKPVDMTNPENMTWADIQRMMEEDKAREAAEKKSRSQKNSR